MGMCCWPSSSWHSSFLLQQGEFTFRICWQPLGSGPEGWRGRTKVQGNSKAFSTWCLSINGLTPLIPKKTSILARDNTAQQWCSSLENSVPPPDGKAELAGQQLVYFSAYKTNINCSIDGRRICCVGKVVIWKGGFLHRECWMKSDFGKEKNKVTFKVTLPCENGLLEFLCLFCCFQIAKIAEDAVPPNILAVLHVCTWKVASRGRGEKINWSLSKIRRWRASALLGPRGIQISRASLIASAVIIIGKHFAIGSRGVCLGGAGVYPRNLYALLLSRWIGFVLSYCTLWLYWPRNREAHGRTRNLWPPAPSCTSLLSFAMH